MSETKHTKVAMKAAGLIFEMINAGNESPDDIATIIEEYTVVPDLLQTAKNLLDKIDNMTTKEFECGGEKQEREALRATIAKAEEN